MKELLLKYKEEHPSDLVIKDQSLKESLMTTFPDISNPKIAAAMLLSDITQQPKCYCGNQLEFVGRTKSEIYITPYGGWRRYCSRKCMYASPDTDKKRKATSLLRHGVEHFSQIQEFESKWSDEKKKRYNEKNKITSLKKFGVEHHSKTPEYLIKRTATSLERHGVENTFQLPKVKENMLAKYGYDSWLKSEAADISRRTRVITTEEKLKSYVTFITRKISSKELCNILIDGDSKKFQSYITDIVDREGYYCRPQIAAHIGLSTSHTNKLFRKFGMQEEYLITKGRSFAESELTEFLKSLNVNYITSDRTILEGKEVDIYIPEYKIGLEYCGVYWHSESMGKYPTYHLEKTLGCEAKGIQLLTIFENEWADPVKREIWKSMIRNRLGKITNKISARLCKFKEIDVKSSREFLESNHLNGFKASRHHYGLLYDNKLVSVMSIGKSYYNAAQNEITRFASKININVQGGMTKMLSKIDTSNLITYADRRFSSPLSASYSTYFSKMSSTNPNWYGIEKGFDLKHRLSYTKDKVKSMLGENYDDSLTSYDNMLKIGIDRIWDCGNLKFSN